MANIAAEFHGVTVLTKANLYFDGKVVSHTVLIPDGTRKTLGLIFPGKFHFNTDKAERMEIVAGTCAVQQDGHDSVQTHPAGEAFEVPAKSGFAVEVADGICEYVCTFLP